jgi:hypothetical protein
MYSVTKKSLALKITDTMPTTKGVFVIVLTSNGMEAYHVDIG